jgi:hypothetical protein
VPDTALAALWRAGIHRSSCRRCWARRRTSRFGWRSRSSSWKFRQGHGAVACSPGSPELWTRCTARPVTGTAPCRTTPFAVIEHACGKIRILGATERRQPCGWFRRRGTSSWTWKTSAAGNGSLIRDRDGKFPTLFDRVITDGAVGIVLSGVRTPRMSSLMAGWVQTCRPELLDRILIWNRPHLLHALREFEQFYNGHRHTRASRTPTRCSHHQHRPSTRTSGRPRHPKTQSPRRYPPRVRTCRVTCRDEVSAAARPGTARKPLVVQQHVNRGTLSRQPQHLWRQDPLHNVGGSLRVRSIRVSTLTQQRFLSIFPGHAHRPRQPRRSIHPLRTAN